MFVNFNFFVKLINWGELVLNYNLVIKIFIFYILGECNIDVIYKFVMIVILSYLKSF